MTLSSQKVLFIILFLVILSCEKTNQNPYKNSVISSAHPLASKSGLEIYKKGGNAFDASVAAAFTLSVVEPSMSGLGGRIQVIYKTSNGNISGIDGSTEVPGNYVDKNEKFKYGYPTIGIPGVVAGLLSLHAGKGNLPLIDVIAPAIKYAKEGFRLLPGEATRQQSVKDELLEFEGTRHHFMVNDSLSFKAGDLFVQNDLAKVLEAIANKGKAGFYEGEIANKIVSDLQSNGSILSLEDLRNYKALESKILTGKFDDKNIFTLFLPSFGAITIQILQILDNLKLPENENEWAIQHGRVTEKAYQFRDLQTDSIKLKEIISYEKGEQLANEIFNKQKEISSVADEMPISWTSVDGHTTHLTTADKWGNVVALTQTIGPTMGSKVASKGLGFLYAVTLGGYLGKYKPGDRANSHISPTFIEKNGKILLALGAAGGSRIIPAVTQVTDRYFRQNHSLETSLKLPRVYPYKDSLWIENHFGIEKLNASFVDKKLPIKYIDEIARFGRVHAVALKGQKWIGCADPDWEGTTEYFPSNEE
jgi:gamma-glutamyltranspeptidase/glutathione hydrolase